MSKRPTRCSPQRQLISLWRWGPSSAPWLIKTRQSKQKEKNLLSQKTTHLHRQGIVGSMLFIDQGLGREYFSRIPSVCVERKHDSPSYQLAFLRSSVGAYQGHRNKQEGRNRWSLELPGQQPRQSVSFRFSEQLYLAQFPAWSVKNTLRKTT